MMDGTVDAMRNRNPLENTAGNVCAGDSSPENKRDNTMRILPRIGGIKSAPRNRSRGLVHSVSRLLIGLIQYLG